MLKNRDFRRLALGSGLNAVGFQGEQVLVSMLIYQLTGSTVWVGIGLAVSFTPMLLIGVPAGATADHFERKRLLPLFELGLMLAFGVAALASRDGAVGVAPLLVLLFVSGSLRAMHFPVRLSYAHDLLGGDKLVSALSMLGVVTRLGQLTGAVMAGSAMERFGPGVAFSLLAGAHVLAWFVFMRLEHTSAPVSDLAERPSLLKNLREYVYELRHNPVLLRLAVLAGMVEIFGFSFATALPELATVQIGTDAEGLGLLHGARSAGGLISGLVLVRTGSELKRGVVYLVTLSGFGVALLALSQVTALGPGMLACGAVAFCAATSDVLAQAMMQACVPDHLRGRAMGAWVLALGAGPAGHLELGSLIVWVGAPLGLALNGGVLLVTGVLVALGAPRIRRL